MNQETRTEGAEGTPPEGTPPEGTPPELPPETAVDATPPPPRAPRPWLALIALVLALAALLAAGAVYLARAPKPDPRIAALDQRIEDLGASLSALRQADRALQDRIGEQTRTIARLQRSVESLRARASADSTDWALAEVENLIVIAMQRLTLARDVDAAIAALNAADSRLAALDDPGLTGVRAQIAGDLNALRGVNDVDVTGLSLFLADLAQRASTLPLRDRYLEEQEERAQTEERPVAKGWRGVLSAVWEEITDLVVISRDRGEGVAATLLPEERYFLVHNLRLQVEVMRLAVLRRDTPTLRSSAQLAAEWLRTYFDTADAGVSSALEALVRMQELELQPQLPAIDSSLETLRAVVRDRMAHGDAPAEPEPAP